MPIFGSSSHAAPPNTANYIACPASNTQIPNGAIVEGSLVAGGLQPDYIIDFESPAFATLRQKMAQIADAKIPFLEKAEAVVNYVKLKTFDSRDYNNPSYQRLMAKYRRAGNDIPLSAYIEARAGVCREDALILHLALKAANIPSKYFYARIKYRRSWFDWIEEDHAFNVVRFEGEDWVLDSNTGRFNGFKLSDLKRGIYRDSEVTGLPFATRWRWVDRQILAIHSYPRVWRPRQSCTTAFAKNS